MTVLAMADGRVLSGVVLAETDATVTVQTGQARVTMPRGDVEERRRQSQSLMPDGLLQPFTSAQVRDLIAYLMSDSQIELPSDKSNGG